MRQRQLGHELSAGVASLKTAQKRLNAQHAPADVSSALARAICVLALVVHDLKAGGGGGAPEERRARYSTHAGAHAGRSRGLAQQAAVIRSLQQRLHPVQQLVRQPVRHGW